MTYWNENGAAPEKLIFGFPAYGQTFTLSDPSNTGICAPTISAGTLGPYTEESGIWAYYEVSTLSYNALWLSGPELCPEICPGIEG